MATPRNSRTPARVGRSGRAIRSGRIGKVASARGARKPGKARKAGRAAAKAASSAKVRRVAGKSTRPAKTVRKAVRAKGVALRKASGPAASRKVQPGARKRSNVARKAVPARKKLPAVRKAARPAPKAAPKAKASAKTAEKSTVRQVLRKLAPKSAKARAATRAKGVATAPGPAAARVRAGGDPRHDEAALGGTLAEAGRAAGMPADALGKSGDDPFAALEWLVPRRGTLPPASEQALMAAAEALLRHRIFAHPGARGEKVAPVVFGTGGHRGEIGRGLTLLHVYAIVTALLRAIAAMAPGERSEQFGAAALEAVQRRGFVLGHDNRLCNPEFAYYAASLLREHGYAVRYAGRVSSPELSLLVPLEGWAGSLNFTPSHNPFRYGGLKFAPADGGLAGGDLTDPLAAEANRLLVATPPGAWTAPGALEARIADEARRIERVDVHDTYLDRLNEHPVIRLAELIAEVKALPPERRLAYVADPVWGAAVPVYQRLQRRFGPDVLRVIHTEVDPYFGGQTTEPNEQTLGDALALLRDSEAASKVAIRNDPDGDRGLVGDDGGALKMNRFAALVFRYLHDIGQSGDLLTTLPTSHLGPDYARAQGSAVVLTATGFKNFRAHLKSGRALVAYEESDGITVRGHTLDKDGVLAGLLAVRIVLHYGRPLTELAAELERQIGRYYYRQETFMIDMSAAEAHQRLKKLGAVQPGTSFEAGGRTHTIRAVNGEDGYKFSLDDGAWVMMRPSGTEPKVRVYAESRASEAFTLELCAAARGMALAAVRNP